MIVKEVFTILRQMSRKEVFSLRSCVLFVVLRAANTEYVVSNSSHVSCKFILLWNFLCWLWSNSRPVEKLDLSVREKIRDRLFVNKLWWCDVVLLWCISKCLTQWPHGLRRGSTYFARWECGYESRQGHESLSLSLSCENCVCCQVEVSAAGWSLIQRSSTKCAVSECDRESLVLRISWPSRDCRAIGKIFASDFHVLR